MDIFDQIAAGVRPQPPESNYTGKAPPSMEEQRLGYVLAKQIPAMAGKQLWGRNDETVY